MNHWKLSATDLAAKIRSGEITSQAATAAYFDRIDATEPTLRSFLATNREQAMQAAQTSDERYRAGKPRSPFDGVPIAIKDVLVTRDFPTTCGSKMLEGYLSPFDATIVERIREAGLIIVGKANMDEFAMGSSCENSAYGSSRNPWDTSRTPGGSSGGSASAVASGQTPLAIGTDTGGSIRLPASFCGITGLKPTYGRVSRYGLVAYASSLDQPGPMARSVRDCAGLLEIIAGNDKRDATSSRRAVPAYSAALGTPAKKGIRVGIPEECLGEGLDPEVKAAFLKARDTLADVGVSFSTVSLPHSKYAVETYYIVATAEASSNLARFDGVRYGHRSKNAETLTDLYELSRSEGFGAEVKRRIMLGTFVLSSGYYDAYFTKACQVRTLIRNDFLRAFEQVDCLMLPTSPTVAFPLGSKVKDPLALYLADIYTTSVNLAGLPGLALPCGFSAPQSTSPKGLPIGMQFIGKDFDEETLLALGDLYQQNTSWHGQYPNL